jgi:O-antigen/teichoic acid export membrane protein
MAEAIPINPSPASNAKGTRALSGWSILRKSSKVSGANLVGVVVLFPVNILMARVLGPELWGVVGYVALWQLYASFSKPGMFGAAFREMPGLLAQGKTAEATRVQNIGITGDAIYLLLPISLMVVVAFFQKDVLLRNGLIVGAGIFGMTQARDILTNIQWAHQRFGLIAKLNILVTFVTAIFMLTTVSRLSYFTPLLSPGIAALTVVLALRLGSPSVGFRFQIDRREMLRLLKIGVPLGLSTLFYWGFRMADRTAVAVWLTLSDLGYFTFVIQFINLAILLVSDFCNVVQPALWAELGRVSNVQSLAAEIRRLSLLVLLVTCLGTNLAQIGFGPLVYWFVPRFIPSVIVFEVIALLLALGTLGFVPSHLLNSATINKQNLVMVVWATSLPVNVGLAYAMVKMGWGLSGIALSSVVTQGLVSAVLLVVAQRRISPKEDSQLGFYGSMIGLLVVTFGVFAAFQLEPLVYGGTNRVVVTLILRVVVFGIVWGTIGSFLYLHRRRVTGLSLSGASLGVDAL